jgi:hypothetical protein
MEDQYNVSINEEGHDIVRDFCVDLSLDGWKLYKFISNCKRTTELMNKYGEFKIIKLGLSLDETKPNLVVICGFSNNSFCNSTKRIIQNLDKITDKFQAIYIIQFDEGPIKLLQKEACRIRDELITGCHPNPYQPEIDLNIDLGIVIDKLLRCVGLDNIHLLGKSAGAGVAINTISKSKCSSIYTALYLAVPSSPNNVEDLDVDSSGRRYIFAWSTHDVYNFSWGRRSNEEKPFYDHTMSTKGIVNYISQEFTNDEDIILDEKDPNKQFHEIPSGLFNLI